MFVPIILFSVICLVSGYINGNSLFLSILGTFDYIKNILVIIIYAAFFDNIRDFKIIFKILLTIVLIIAAFAAAQFVWAMGSVYLLGKDIMDPGAYLFSMQLLSSPETMKNISWRYGLYRTTPYAYVLGLYCLLILTQYLYMTKKTNIAFITTLFLGVIASVSRIAYAGLFFVISLQVHRKIKWLVPVLIIISMAILSNLNSQDETNILRILNLSGPEQSEQAEADDIRLYTRKKSIEIWKDHPVFGVGPGMFGGIVASMYDSYIYEEYNVQRIAYLKRVGNIEQFWFQILPETGMAGTLCFGSIFVVLLYMFSWCRKQALSEDLKNIFSSLMAFMICILIYTAGSGINIAPVLFTYCAFAGMALGCLGNEFITENVHNKEGQG